MRTLVFDTETTDLIKNSSRPLAKQPYIIEFFGLVLNDSFEEVDSYHSYFKPPNPITPEITKITGITNEMVHDAAPFSGNNVMLLDFIHSCDGAVAHNLSYDMMVVNFEFKRIKKKVNWPARRICTVEATEHIKGYRLNLGSLHLELFGEGFTGAHRAENDVRALSRCYIELVNRGEV